MSHFDRGGGIGQTYGMGWLEAAKAYTITTLNFESLAVLDGYTADDGEPLVSAVIKMYLEETPQSLAQLVTAVQDDEQIKIHQLAHALKSTSANLGALHFASLCEKVEMLADPEQHETMVDCSSFLNKIQREFVTVQRDLSVIRLLVRGEAIPPELLKS